MKEAVTTHTYAFSFRRAENLTKKDINGKADPYVVVTYENQRYETKVWQKKYLLEVYND